MDNTYDTNSHATVLNNRHGAVTVVLTHVRAGSYLI